MIEWTCCVTTDTERRLRPFENTTITANWLAIMSIEESHPQDRPDEADAEATAADDASKADAPATDAAEESEQVLESDTVADAETAADADEAEMAGEETVLDEDESTVAEPAARSLGDDAGTVENSDKTALAEHTASVAGKDDTGDTAGINEEMVDDSALSKGSVPLRWDFRRGANDAAVELKRIETEVRKLLDNCDNRRKRKLGGTYRWKELEDDLISWRFGGRINDDTINQLQRLIVKRNYHFQQLRFLSSTRTAWNS